MESNNGRGSLTNRYLTALLAPAVIAGVMQVTWPFFQHNPVLPYLLAVIFCAWYGGLGPGLLSVVISFLLTDFFFVEPYFFFWFPKQVDLVRLLLFAVVGPFISVMSELMHRARRRAGINLESAKRAERSLREKERFANQIAELSPVVINVFDLATRRDVYISPDVVNLLGYTPKEIAEMEDPFSVLWHPEDIPRASENLARLKHARDGEIAEFEYRIRRRDGEWRWVATRGISFERDEHGEVRQIVTATLDITERKQAEDAVREAERKYRSIFENAGEGIFQSTPDGRFIAANPALARMHGFASPEELIHSRQDISRQLYVDPTRREEFKRQLEQQDAVRGFEYQVFRKDGSKIWISVNARAVRDEQGEIQYYEGTAQDITDRKRAEEALRESEERYRDLVENSLDLICTHDLNGLILSANRAAMETMGYSSGSYAGGTNLREILAPEVRDQFDNYLKRIRADGVASGLMLVQTRTGEKRIWEYRNTLRTQGVSAPIVRGMARDITERKRVEEALRESERFRRMIIESEPECVKLVAPDYTLLDMNPAGLKMIEATSRERVIGQSVLSLIAPQCRSIFMGMHERVCQGESLVTEFEIVGLKGSRRWMESHAAPLLDKESKVIAQLAITRDVTERKRAEEALKLFRTLIDQSSDAIEVIDQDTFRFLDCNESAYRTLGYNREEFLSLNVFDIDPLVDRSMIAGPDEEMDKSGFATLESIHRRKDGSTFPVEINVKVVRLERNYRLAVVRDITERKRAENSLQESEERFRQLSEAAFEAIILHDQGTILAVNQSFCRMYGYERAEVRGKSVLDLALPEFRELLLQRVRSEDTDSYEGPALRKDGTTFRAEVAGKPIHYQGRVVRVAAIRDITEQKRNERRQAAQYAVTRVLTESATLADAVPKLLQAICESLRWKMGEFWRVCDSTNLLCCVETWHVPALDATSFIEASRQTELAPGVGLPGRVWQSGQPAWSPDVMTDPRFARAAIAAKVGLRGAVAFPILLGNHTLGVMQFFSRRTPEVDEDLLKIMSAIGSQIGQFTERKRAEEALLVSERKYRDIFTFAPVGIYQSLGDGTLITANQTLAEMLGYASVDELLKVKLGAGMYSAEDEREKLIREHEVRGYPVDLELQWKTKDGSPIWIQLSAHAIKGANGVTEYWEGFVRDITERKRAGDALRQTEQQYESLVHSIDGIVWEVDPQTFRFTFVSKEAERLLGYPLAQWLNEPNFWADHTHPDDRKWAVDFCLKATATKENHQFEYRMIAVDGRVVWLKDNVTVSVMDDKSVRLRGVMMDITERKRAEDALRESEERYRDLVENSREFICTHDLNGLILSANRAASEMLGYDLKDWCGKKNFRDLLVPEVCDQFDDYLARIRRDGVASGTTLVQTSSGKRRILEYHNTVRTEGVATPIVRGMARDITEQRRAEKVMSDLRHELELTMNTMEEGVHRVDLKGNIVFENPAAARMLGWGIDQLLGKPAHLTMHHTRQDGTPYPKEECPIYAMLRDGVSRQVADEVFWRQDGTSFPVEYMTAPMRNDRNEIVAAVVTFRDVTERKRADEKLQNSEKYFRSLIENASDLITISDGNGIIRYESPSLERMLGYKPEERIGKSVLDLLHPDDLPFAKRHFAKGIRNPGIVHVMECRFQHKDGSWHLVETTGINLLDDPVVAGIVVNSHDITERKWAEEALRSYPRRLIEAQEAERKHIARELHDQIGQVLTAVRINLQTIGNSCETAESRSLIDQGVALTDAALEQVRDLSFELRPSLLDNLGLVAALRWYSDQYAKRTGIRTKSVTNLPEGQTRLRHELETACFRIVQEALTNVVRHANAKNVSIDLRRLDHKIVLSIKDDGIGFDELSANGGASATRLGLMGMKERALALGGTLEIESAPAQGTKIRAYFPTESKED